MEEHPFLKLVKEGKIIFTSEGKIMGLNEFQIILPVRVMNRLFFLLNQEIPGKASSILKELGKFQIIQAIERYKSVLHWSEIEKEKAFEFGTKFLLPTLGLGVFNIKKREGCFFISTSKTPFAEELILEYGKQNEPIDYYLCGMWEEVFTIFTGKPMICEEVKCYAKGDDCCEFVVKPKE
jgi:predicted hydrocarbon binding protein